MKLGLFQCVQKGVGAFWQLLSFWTLFDSETDKLIDWVPGVGAFWQLDKGNDCRSACNFELARTGSTGWKPKPGVGGVHINPCEPNERPIDKPACGQFVAIDESQLSCYSNPFMNTCKVFLLKVSDTWVWSSSNFLVFKLSLCLGSASSGVSARFHVPGEGQSVTGQHKLQH